VAAVVVVALRGREVSVLVSGWMGGSVGGGGDGGGQVVVRWMVVKWWSGAFGR